ncbi:MAG: 50S ribosomal protein L4 [Acidimicrobiales bacterium]|jgi:large subunit ribosomal protein L4
MSVLPATTSRPDGKRGERTAPERRKVQRRRIDGSVADEVVLDPQVFGLAPNAALVHQVVTSQLAAARSGTQSTRTRAEVSGGGSKPFRQKGTGRARQGSIRAPQWTGGGVALGPKPRSYRQRTPKRMTRLALHCALSDRASEARVGLVEDWAFEEPKTRDARSALEVLGIGGRVLVVLGPDDGIADRSFANLPHVQCVQLAELNAYDVVRCDWVVFTDATLPGETEVLATGPEIAEADGSDVAETAGSDVAETAGSDVAETAGSDVAEADEGEGSGR